MKICGIIVEYNPMHLGHRHHIQQAREISGCDILIAIMSPNFTQRGLPAIATKQQRVLSALKNGVDIVIELPTVCAVQAADQFGQYAVEILAKAQIDSLIFGSETNNLENLKEIAEMPFNLNYFKERIDNGFSYASSYPLDETRFYPNDLLALSYLKAIQNKNITPYTIQRTNAYHDSSLNGPILSASAIRTHRDDIKAQQQCLTENLLTIDENKMFDLIKYQLLTNPDLENIFLMEEGLHNLFLEKINQVDSYQELINSCVSKRYSKSRITRVLCHLMLNSQKQDVQKIISHLPLRILGFNRKTASPYLKHLKKMGIKTATQVNHLPAFYFNNEKKNSLIYGLLTNQKDLLQQEVCWLTILDQE